MFKSLGKIFGKLVASPVELHASETCPECGSRLARDADGWGERPREPVLADGHHGSSVASLHQPEVWHCPNPDCPPQVLKRVLLWASQEAMDIAGCDTALVAQLVKRGLVRDAAEFYRLKVKELEALPGMDKESARRLFDAITASLKREAWRALFGLGIPNIGAAEAQTLCKHVATLDALFAMGRERLSKLDGVTEIMARSVAHWSGDPVSGRLIRRLEKAGVNFRSDLFEPG
jgi:DNA ligase (NAD+)